MSYTTRKSLLQRITDHDEIAWDDFYNMYKPIILTVGNDKRLGREEKNELVQDVMFYLFGKARTFQYDPSKGRFRDYLKRICIHKAYDIMRKRQDHTESLEAKYDSEELSAPSEDFDRLWEAEWRKHALMHALDEVKAQITPVNYQIFRAVTLDEVSPREVAELFDVTENNVYAIKARTLKTLRKHLERYIEGGI